MKCFYEDIMNDKNNLFHVEKEIVINYLVYRVANEAWLKYHCEDFAPADVMEKVKNAPLRVLTKRVFSNSKIKLFDGDGEGYYFDALHGVKMDDLDLVVTYNGFHFTPVGLNGKAYDFSELIERVPFDQIENDAMNLPLPLFRLKYMFR